MSKREYTGTFVGLFSSLERRGHLLVFTATPFSSNDTGLRQVGVFEAKSECGPTLHICCLICSLIYPECILHFEF